MSTIARRAAVLAVAVLAGCGAPGGSIDSLGRPLGEPVEQAAWRESAVSFPLPPRDADLIEFRVSNAVPARHFVDRRSVMVTPERVVRATVVIRPDAGGVRQVTYEGYRCATREHRLYGNAAADGAWTAARSDSWRPLAGAGGLDYRIVLNRDFFCPVGSIIESAREGVDALERGNHPRVVQ